MINVVTDLNTHIIMKHYSINLFCLSLDDCVNLNSMTIFIKISLFLIISFF